MWHVISRSGVATLRTAVHLLLTYLPLAQRLVGARVVCDKKSNQQQAAGALTFPLRRSSVPPGPVMEKCDVIDRSGST